MAFLDNTGLSHLIDTIKAKLDSKSDKTHTHNYAGSSSAGGAATTALACTGNSATATLAKKSNSSVGFTTAGTGAAYTVTVDGITALTAGVSFTMIPHTVSTTTAPTINVNSLGAKNIRMRVSSSPTTTTALASSNFLSANKPVKLLYDGTYWIVDDMVRPNANALYGNVPVTGGGTGANNATDARINLGIETRGGTTISGNADYAEVGEWADGNTNDEDRIGYFVAIDNETAGKTMVKANASSDVRGVTVSAPAFSGNCSADKFNENGELKKQYDYVAVMGMVSVIDNGTCTINGRCMPNDNGTAIPSPNNMGYQVIDRIDSTHVLVAVEPSADMMVRIKEDVTQLQTGKANASHTHSASNITSGTLPIARGGTGATDAATARANLGITDEIVYGTTAPTSSTVGSIYIQTI